MIETLKGVMEKLIFFYQKINYANDSYEPTGFEPNIIFSKRGYENAPQVLTFYLSQSQQTNLINDRRSFFSGESFKIIVLANPEPSTA